MAQDMDFRRRAPQSNATRPVSNANQNLTAESLLTPHPRGKHPARKKPQFILWLVIVGLALSATGAYYWSTLPPSAQTPQAQSQEQKSSEFTNSTSGDVFSRKESPTIQIYQGGAPETIITQTVATLKDAGYTVENLGASQFEYDKTYIWYTAAYSEEAQKIGALLQGRVISYRESQSAGVFDVLVYLGKQ